MRFYGAAACGSVAVDQSESGSLPCTGYHAGGTAVLLLPSSAKLGDVVEARGLVHDTFLLGAN